MAIERLSDPKHLSVHFSADEYETIEKAATESGQAVNDAVYSALLVKLGAAMQGFVSENGLQDLVIDVQVEVFAEDVTEEDLDIIDSVLGDALRADGSIDYVKLHAKGEVIDLDEWESSS